MISEGVGLLATLVVDEEGLFPSLRGLAPGPRHVPLLPLHSAVEDIVLLVEDTCLGLLLLVFLERLAASSAGIHMIVHPPHQ